MTEHDWTGSGPHATELILLSVQNERARQEELKTNGKFTYTCADSDIPYSECLAVLAEEFGEVSREVTEHIISTRKYAADTKLRTYDARREEHLAVMPPHREEYFRQHLLKELVQVAAVAVAWCERLERDSAMYWSSRIKNENTPSQNSTCGTTSSENK